MYSNTKKILNRPAAGLRRVTNCCCKYYSGRSKGEAADEHRLEGWPLPAGCRAPSPRIAAVLGSLQSAASLALGDPQGDGLGRRTSRTWLLTRWHSNLPPLVREKSAKTRCFAFFLFFSFFLWHSLRVHCKDSDISIAVLELSKKMRFFFFWCKRFEKQLLGATHMWCTPRVLSSGHLQPQHKHERASLVVRKVKNPLAMQKIWVWSLGWEDSLEEGMATHSSMIAWRIPWTEEPGRLQSMGSQRVWHN